jgi:hypothetical protein
MLGAYYLVVKVLPLVRSLDFSFFRKEEEEASEIDLW